jgi:hypothetical protein
MKTLITLIKLKELEDAKHPNNIPEGHKTRGWLMVEPEIGKRFQVNSFWSTSPVTALLENDTFKTLNSLYKIERMLVADDCNVFDWIVGGKN